MTDEEETPKLKKRQESPVLKWVFTWFPIEVEETDPKLRNIYETHCKKLIAQEEKCPKTGRTHVQGALWLNKKKRLTSMKKILPTAHWEHMRSEKGSTEYCLKEETRCGAQWLMGVPQAVKDPLEDKELYPWQNTIIQIIRDEPEDRPIYWVYDPSGRTGKTALCKHLCLKYGALMTGGNAKDAQHGIAAAIDKEKNIRIVLMNIPRSVDNAEHISYQAIEAIKDGLFFSGKYESTMCIFDPPHMVIMSNLIPIYSKLTKDRWRIVHPNSNTITSINDEEEVDEYGAGPP